MPKRVIRRVSLFLIKTIHLLAFLVIQSAIFYFLYKGLRGQSDRRAAAALAVAATESAVYAGNGFRCPLTDVAERLGDEHGAVTDIFLPGWLARNIANIYVPILAAGIILHTRNIRAHAKRETSVSRTL